MTSQEHKEYNKKWHREHKRQRQEYFKKWYQEHKEHVKQYRQKNHKNLYEKNKLYIYNRLKIDMNFKIACNLRTRIREAIKENFKTGHMIELLGCSIEFLRNYLEYYFTEGMNWGNYGEWHIDHRISCASFDLSKEEEQRKCFHYTNLQPLWAKDNQIKGAKYENVR